jgi:phage/plasmid-like protein (TIGR03299 family)
MAAITPAGETYTDAGRKVIVRPSKTFGPDDEGAILGTFRDGYKVHGYDQWLTRNVEAILDDGLSVGSAGLLKGGAVAWVQVELPESIDTPEGVRFRPYLTAATSLDGSLATTYMTGATVVVCDNTLSAALGESGRGVFKVKHSRNSLSRIGEARDALGIIYSVADEFAAQVAQLSSITVSDAQWDAFLNAHAPMPADKGRSLTMATNQRDTLTRLYKRDPRVAPWTGTAFGVLQAVNTYVHHEGIVRGASRPERNMLRMVTGGVDALDQGTLNTLVRVLVPAA